MPRVHPITGYFLKVLHANDPVQYVGLTLEEVAVDQDPLPPAEGPLVNPAGLAWDDPDHPGRTRRVSCNFVSMLATGEGYTVILHGQSQGGDTEGSEPSAPFAIDPVRRPDAPTGLRLLGA